MQITLPKYFQIFVDNTIERSFDLIVLFEYAPAYRGRLDEQGTGASAYIQRADIKFQDPLGNSRTLRVTAILNDEQIADIEAAILRQLEKEECSACAA